MDNLVAVRTPNGYVLDIGSIALYFDFAYVPEYIVKRENGFSFLTKAPERWPIKETVYKIVKSDLLPFLSRA